jgi:hypothetical protein
MAMHLGSRKRPARAISVLEALELLDDLMRRSPGAQEYVGSAAEQTVAMAITRGRRRREPKVIRPRPDQTTMDEVLHRYIQNSSRLTL